MLCAKKILFISSEASSPELTVENENEREKVITPFLFFERLEQYKKRLTLLTFPLKKI